MYKVLNFHYEFGLFGAKKEKIEKALEDYLNNIKDEYEVVSIILHEENMGLYYQIIVKG